MSEQPVAQIETCDCGAACIPTKCDSFLSDETTWECARCSKPLADERIPDFFKQSRA